MVFKRRQGTESYTIASVDHRRRSHKLSTGERKGKDTEPCSEPPERNTALYCEFREVRVGLLVAEFLQGYHDSFQASVLNVKHPLHPCRALHHTQTLILPPKCLI